METSDKDPVLKTETQRCPIRQLRALVKLRRAARAVLDDNLKGIDPESRLEDVAVECCDMALDGKTVLAEIEDELGVPENSLRDQITELAGVTDVLDAKLQDVIAVAKDGLVAHQNEASVEPSA